MADTEKVLAKGTLASTDETTIATVPNTKHFVITNFVIHNSDTSERTVSLKIDDVPLLTEESIPTKKTLGLRPELGGTYVAQNDTIKLQASAAGVIHYYLSGIEADGGGE